MNTQILKIIEITLATFLVVLITFQTKGNALSESVSSAFSVNRTKRGFEKFIFYFTIAVIIGFSINTILLMLFK